MLILVGCAAKNPVDNKPVITICGLDVKSGVGNCGKTGQNIVTQPKPVPLSALDKFIAISIEDWATTKKYQDKLEIYARYMDKKYKN